MTTKKGILIMHRVLIIGAGKIGSLIAVLLSNTKDYQVYLADHDPNNPNLKKIFNKETKIELVKLDAKKPEEIMNFLKTNPVDSIISSLPFYCNIPIANLVKELNLNYFDTTEDVNTTKHVEQLAKESKKAFVPQCGLAPGFISIATNHLMQQFSELDEVKMRVGALPINVSNALQYSITWSIDGLINEYGNLCEAIENGENVTLLPLDDIEEIKIDGLTYEAFNTSGGIGSLARTYHEKVRFINYKTIRYPGHCNKMRFLMNDLKLNYDRETLKRIIEKSIPKTGQDVALIYVSVTGKQEGIYSEESYVKKIYPQIINGTHWSAIQVTTAASASAVFDIVVSQPEKYQGFIKQEQISFDTFIQNRFGEYYA